MYFCDRHSRLSKQPTPRKGTETFSMFSSFLMLAGNNPHPARGRKLNTSGSCELDCRNNPHPARGRKPGNEILALVVFGNNPHPARGRKPHFVTPCTALCAETTHTPQGDGNSNGIASPISLHMKQPTPRKGTETPSCAKAPQNSPKQPTPRKGTENHLCSHCRNCWRNHSHPRQGTTDKKGA